MRIEDEIKQKTFRNNWVKTDINIMFTASYLSALKHDALKRFGISWQQFNILRILRGQHPEPSTIKLLTERMIDKMSNASRLVDKLVKKGYAERKTCPQDRRKVDILITEEGLNMLSDASDRLEAYLMEKLKHLSNKEAIQLNHLLDKIRE